MILRQVKRETLNKGGVLRLRLFRLIHDVAVRFNEFAGRSDWLDQIGFLIQRYVVFFIAARHRSIKAIFLVFIPSELRSKANYSAVPSAVHQESHLGSGKIGVS